MCSFRRNDQSKVLPEIFYYCYLFILKIAFGGLGAAILGKWTMKVGTRYSMFLGGALFGTAFATAGAGVAMHSLPLLYFGNCKLFEVRSN